MLLSNRYKLLDKIARTPVYRSIDTYTGKSVAIKSTHSVDVAPPYQALSLHHPNIVHVLEYITENDNCYIVSKLVEGSDLTRYLKIRSRLSTDEIIAIARGITSGLGYAHSRGITHGDIKPQNILIDRDYVIKISDFGTRHSIIHHPTIKYTSPEQLQGQAANSTTDIYSLGIVLYELLSGRAPFDGDSAEAIAMQHIQDLPVPPSQLNMNTPPALEEIVLKCMEKQSEKRYQDANKLAHFLNQDF
jgi:serine/threonine protein kinase